SADRSDGPPIAVVSATLAERLWPGEDAVGKRLYWGGVGGDPLTVVGVVGDYLDVQVDEGPQPLLFLPNNRLAWPSMTLVVRTDGSAAPIADGLREAIHAVDPLLPVPEVRPLERSLATAVAGPRFRSLLLGSFAAVALLLAGLGVYGVTAFGVARRTREFGVRIALGATPAHIAGMVLRGGAFLASIGVALGAAGAWALARFLETLLYDVSPGD